MADAKDVYDLVKDHLGKHPLKMERDIEKITLEALTAISENDDMEIVDGIDYSAEVMLVRDCIRGALTDAVWAGVLNGLMQWKMDGWEKKNGGD